jgi:DtxR family Mn-dependent transcriptional regulator
MSMMRVHMEDALKHLYDCEYRNLIGTRQSIAGALEVSHDDAASLLVKLEEMGLVKSQGDGSRLTEEGRSYALRVIRVHRLWERYLADETGLPEMEWHADAERREHLLTPNEVETLSSHMGNPRYDPHGDPIPTKTGEIPDRIGRPLTEIAVGDTAEITHIEDEPTVVYAQLVALGLHPGMRVRVMDISSQRIRFEADGVENVVAPIVAANITAQALPPSESVESPFQTLDLLKPGEEARVVGIARRCHGQQRRRLMDLGIVPGTRVRAEMRSAGGDPTAYAVRGALIALRSQQARMVRIRRDGETTR